MKVKLLIAGLCILLAIGCWNCEQKGGRTINLNPGENDLVFNKLASIWDEGMPIGNGLIGGKDHDEPSNG